MHCLKCGTQTIGDRVFCDNCLETMDKHPVKPGTPVQIPKRLTAAEVKRNSSRKKALTPEEQLERMQKAVKWLVLTIITLLLALTLSVLLLFQSIEAKSEAPATGQEYTPIGTVSGV